MKMRILTGNLKERFQEFIIRHYNDIKRVFYLQCDVTAQCNLRCKHCYAKDKYSQEKKNRLMTLKEWEKVLIDFQRLSNEQQTKARILLSGGEPLLYKELKEFVALIKQTVRDPEVVILTNGTLINKDICGVLASHNINVQISLEGPSREVNDAVRGKNSYDKSISGIRLLNDYSIPFIIQVTLGCRVVNYIEGLFLLAQKLNAKELNFCRLVAIGQARSQLIKDGIDYPLEGNSLKKAMENILNLSRQYEVKTNTDHPLWHLIDESLGSPMGLGFLCLIVESNGNVKASSRSDFILGNIRNEGIRSMYYHNKYLKQFRTQIVSECKGCNDFKVCAGGNRDVAYSRFNHFFARDPGCWKHLTNR